MPRRPMPRVASMRWPPNWRRCRRRAVILWRALRRAPPQPRGVYMWGGVGRGKSMLMDLFFDCVAIRRKRRVHFHAFMGEVHAALHAERQREAGDPIAPVAARMAEDVRLLAFDELVVNNTADAAILSRLFTALIGGGDHDRRDLQPAAVRPVQGRPEPRAVPAVPRSAGRESWTCSRSTDRPITGSTGWAVSIPGWCPTGRRRPPA